VADLLDTITLEVNQRRDELRPLVAEYDLLVAAREALGGGQMASARGGEYGHREIPAGASELRSATHELALGTRRPVRRPMGRGERRAQALAAITQQPGITLPELAEVMAVYVSYLYRVVPGLVNARKVVRDGKRYWPA
jgi:hypothetical protein